MAKITKVPDGPLIKKKGLFKGSTLKSGGKINNSLNNNNMAIKKAQAGATTAKKNIKDATQMKNMRPIFKGKDSGVPVPKPKYVGGSKAQSGKTVKKAQSGIIAKASKAISGAADTAGKWIKAHQTGGDETDRQRNLPAAPKTVKPKAKCGTKMKKK